MGFIRNGEQYFYFTNQMGDVLSIADAGGDELVEYEYDEWGNTIGIIPTDSNSEEQLALANANPLRYRGYYYDNETGYYYLQSRYYDPSICRFINADTADIAQMTKDIPVGANAFAYCNNDPVNISDPSGKFPINLVIGALVGAICGALGKILEYVIDDLIKYRKIYPKKIKWGKVVVAAVFGAASGALSASSGKKMVQKVGTAIISFSSTLVSGGTVLEAVITTIIAVLLTNESGLGKSLRKFNSKKVNRSFSSVNKISKSTIKKVAKTLSKSITYYFKSNKTLYNRFIKNLIKSNSRDWLISFGLGRYIRR